MYRSAPSGHHPQEAGGRLRRAAAAQAAPTRHGHPVLKTFLFYAGFFLIFLLFSEEFRSGLQRGRAVVRQRPHLKYLAYPLAAAALLLAAALIVNSLVTLFTSILFSYE